MKTPQILNEWLDWFDKQPQAKPRLDLKYIRCFLTRHASLAQFSCPIVVVGGTNGKGSCVAAIQAIYHQAGYKVGSCTSPHLNHICERITINMQHVQPDQLSQALTWIYQRDPQRQLSFFEYLTLASLYLFKQNDLDLIILEIGLGGRLDANNCLDHDVAIITSVDLDHTAWLGNTLDKIATEKAGIIRKKKPVIYGMSNCPNPIKKISMAHQASLYISQHDWHTHQNPGQWSFNSKKRHLQFSTNPSLPLPSLACAIKATEHIPKLAPIPDSTILKALNTLTLPGRWETYRYKQRTCLFDVAHNPAATQYLAQFIQKQKRPQVYAIFHVAKDKDYRRMIDIMKPLVSAWFIFENTVKRLEKTDILAETLQEKACNHSVYSSIPTLLDSIVKISNKSDLIVTFGSFLTVSMVKREVGV